MFFLASSAEKINKKKSAWISGGANLKVTPASSGRGHLSKYSPNPRHHHHHLLFLHSPVRVKEWEAGRLAEESRAKSLNVPQQQHQELRRGQPSVCASVPVHRAKVALLGGVDVSFLIFAASVHYPGRLKTRALIPSNPSQNTHTHRTHNSRRYTAVRHFCEELVYEYAYFSLMLCSTRAHALQEGCVASLEFNCGCWKPSHVVTLQQIRLVAHIQTHATAKFERK